MNQSQPLRSFEAFGIELEYMLVDRETLDVKPVGDRVLESLAGEPASDYESGPITWSNELALHVLELKGTLPTSNLLSLSNHLLNSIGDIEPALKAHNVMLLPSGMHPWMNPSSETKLWPHECSEIYQAYHGIFNCFAHGWSNVQSVHLNLPFSGDEEFARLHAAVRILLPILPALTASSPVVDGRRAPWADMRMQKVREHCWQVPFLTGDLIPEPIYDEASYREQIFARLKTEIASHDPGKVFDPNFLNSRGAIARFDRGSVEVRVMDVQENPRVDIAICLAAIATLKALTKEQWQPLSEQKLVPTKLLSGLLDKVSETAEATLIEDAEYLRQFGIEDRSITASELWNHILEVANAHEPSLDRLMPILDEVLRHGSLATRIQKAIGVGKVGDQVDRERLSEVYRELGRCLRAGKLFIG